MKKVITAFNNPKLNEKLKEQKNIEIISKDIQYKEGILEILKKFKKVDIIIINKKLEGEILIEELINKINKINSNIKIILIAEAYKKNQKEIKEEKNLKIITTKKVKIEEIINSINNQKEIKKEIIENIKIKNKTKKKIEKKIEKNLEKKEIKKICIIRANNTGKNILTIIIAKILKNKKILILKSDVKNKNIVQKENNKKNNILEKINDNIDIAKLKNIDIIEEKKYEKIFLDVEINNGKEEIENIIKKADFFLLIIEPNIKGIKQIKEIIDKNLKKIKTDKIKIIINNKKINSIYKGIIKKILYNIKILVEIKKEK